MPERAFLLFEKGDNRSRRAKTDKEILLGANYAIISSETSHISRRAELLLEGDHGALPRLMWTGKSSRTLLKMKLSSSVASTIA